MIKLRGLEKLPPRMGPAPKVQQPAATATANAGLRPFQAGLEVNLKGISLGGLVDNFITLYSNACYDAGLLGILNSLSPIFDQEP